MQNFPHSFIHGPVQDHVSLLIVIMPSAPTVQASHRAHPRQGMAWQLQSLRRPTTRRPALTGAATRRTHRELRSGRRNALGRTKKLTRQGKQGRKKARRSSPRLLPLDTSSPIQGWATAASTLPTRLASSPAMSNSPAGSTSDDIHINPVDHGRPVSGSMIGQAASRVGNVEAAVAHPAMRCFRNFGGTKPARSPSMSRQNEANPESVIDGDRSRI